MSTREIGFIGLGRMGLPMVRNLAAKGYAVHVFDVAPEALKRAGAVTGLRTQAAPRDVAARASVVFTALPNDAIVTDTYLGPGGILAGAHPGLVTCDCSTVSPDVSQRIHAEAKGRGVSHLDTPMLGSSPQAESGEVFFMVGGDREALAAVQPMLDAMGRLTMHVGPSGTGNRIKLLHNALGAVNAVAAAESLALCTRLGVDPRTYYDVVCKGGGCKVKSKTLKHSGGTLNVLKALRALKLKPGAKVTVTVRVSDDDGKSTDETEVVRVQGGSRPAICKQASWKQKRPCRTR